MKLTSAYDKFVESWLRALDLRDPSLEEHSQRVAALAVALAIAMGVDQNEVPHIKRGALLHDIGKLVIPDKILHKPGPLTPPEWATMCRHTEYAYYFLSPVSSLHPAWVIPYYHHEKWDGSGYPARLKGKAIPLAARIFAVIDVWDALLSDRPYRASWPKAKAREHICSLAGVHFDPKVVEAFWGVV